MDIPVILIGGQFPQRAVDALAQKQYFIRFIQHAEIRVDTGFNGVFTEQRGAKGVKSADVIVEKSVLEFLKMRSWVLCSSFSMAA
jgi:hypothetical protein